jgi:hypothetical protein
VHAVTRIIRAAAATTWIAAALWVAPAAAGPYTQLQVLLPGETAAPGTGTGKSGSPTAQTANVPFSITVRACDDAWNTVSVTNAIQVLSSDASATLPPSAQFVAGTATFTVTFNAFGTFTISADDLTDNTIPNGVSSAVQSLVLQGFTFSTINQKNQYAGIPMSVSLQARDPSGAVVTGYNGQVHLKEITSYGDGRITPEYVTLASGSWTGDVTMYRADETSINRGNVNLYAYLDANPAKNGTSDPFTVHPGPFSRVQIVVPGETPLPGSPSGKTGSPATQSAGRAFTVDIWATDAYWNQVPSTDNVRIVSSDPAANTPQTGALSGAPFGHRTFSVSLGTVGTQTLTVSDLTNTSIQGMTSPGIPVIPSSVDHFVVSTIASPQTAGVPVDVTIRATDSNGNTVPNYAGDAVLVANTGAGSITPEAISFTNGQWSGPMTFRGAGQNVSFTCADYVSPPHTGTSNNFVVDPGPFAGLQVLAPAETPKGGTADGKEGPVTTQAAGTPFTLTVRAVDDYWNLVTSVSDSIALSSTDEFAGMPARTALANGQLLIPTTLYRIGLQTITATDITQPSMHPNTSSPIPVTGGTFSRLLVLAPGERVAPGTVSGRTGDPTDESMSYSFIVTVVATDQWWNPVGGVTDVARITSDAPSSDVVLPPDEALVDGQAEMAITLNRGGYNQICVSDVSQSTITGSCTQVSVIQSGFHLVASVSPDTVRAGENFTLTVKAVNAAGSVIRDINSLVTVEAQRASVQPPTPGRGTLVPTQFQLFQGQRAIPVYYTFAEPIVIIARDDAGNQSGASNAIAIVPGQPESLKVSSSPPWVGGNKHATISALVTDRYSNPIPGEPMTFELISGTGTLGPSENVTGSDGVAHADFLSPRQPDTTVIRATSNNLVKDLNLQTAFVDPYAKGGFVTNYPNPFHPPDQPTTIAYKLDDDAEVTLRIFTQSGDLVLRKTFPRGDVGGTLGLNEVPWDGKNGKGETVASGGYIALIEAQGQGETLHVIRRKIAVVR